jgi:hypothetical protein
MIYKYYQSFDNLLEAYIDETDFWMLFSERVQELIDNNNHSSSEMLVRNILTSQFRHFSSDSNMQKLILWEISTKSPLMRSIHNARESAGQKVLEKTDEHFSGSSVNLRAITALLIGGIYYTVLHARFNGGVFSDMDISTKEGQDEMVRAIENIISWAYREAEKEKC